MKQIICHYSIIRVIYLVIFISLYSCQKPPDCFKITFKEQTRDGRYYFHWGDFDNNFGHNEKQLDIRSGEVTSYEYREYEVGDTYCRE